MLRSRDPGEEPSSLATQGRHPGSSRDPLPGSRSAGSDPAAARSVVRPAGIEPAAPGVKVRCTASRARGACPDWCTEWGTTQAPAATGFPSVRRACMRHRGRLSRQDSRESMVRRGGLEPPLSLTCPVYSRGPSPLGSSTQVSTGRRSAEALAGHPARSNAEAGRAWAPPGADVSTTAAGAAPRRAPPRCVSTCRRVGARRPISSTVQFSSLASRRGQRVLEGPCAVRQHRTQGRRTGDRTRTCNLRFWRPLLYQLSYTHSAVQLSATCSCAAPGRFVPQNTKAAPDCFRSGSVLRDVFVGVRSSSSGCGGCATARSAGSTA